MIPLILAALAGGLVTAVLLVLVLSSERFYQAFHAALHKTNTAFYYAAIDTWLRLKGHRQSTRPLLKNVSRTSRRRIARQMGKIHFGNL